MGVFSYLVQDIATRDVSEKIDEILLEVHAEWQLRLGDTNCNEIYQPAFSVDLQYHRNPFE
jgi:hypothetical protein